MKCLICGTTITKKTLDINKMLSKKEAMRLYSIRKEKQICSSCSTSYLMLDLGFKTVI
jgi:hypothetical protein